MISERKDTGSLLPRELQVVYAISGAVSSIADTETILDQIVLLSREVFIFDTIVVYTNIDGTSLEPTYVRAMGRGRYREADLSWGELTAEDAYTTNKSVTQVEELEGADIDRTNLRYSLGLPLRIGEKTMGALVFVRFGGPNFTSDHINLAEFIAVHISQLLNHNKLVEQIAGLEAKRRLDSLQDDFIATVSHELLTPLGFIKGYATTLLREDIKWDDESRHEFLTIIDDEADHLRKLLDNLLDSSRLQAGTLQLSYQPVRLDTTIRDILLRMKSRNENLSIEFKNNTKNIKIHADPIRIAQVIDNIIGNAIKYAPGSPIQIRTDIIENQACISISDFGPGISSEHLDKIFKRFYRVPDQNSTISGTGLGLYICRKIVQAHGGIITVKSKVGEGTTFLIYLPAGK